eukprot:Phypoly_transcript_18280.p1 GENE.Phypoly_transcript_18280~~Phypoly_transcript_18280.p1  ORF type:complete len:248 (+),score=56.99 Phypoly_transcript_18280:75-746(+)
MTSHYGNGEDHDEEGLDYLLESNTFEDNNNNNNNNNNLPNGTHHHTFPQHFHPPLPSNFPTTNSQTTTSTTSLDSTKNILGDPTSNVVDSTNLSPEDVAKEAESLRVSMELEFVQCLANPRYLHFLAQQRYFQDQAFVNYLKYLLYWKKPEYAKFIVYPHALFFLDRLQEESFRKELLNATFVELLWRQQFNHWRYYKLHRTAAPPTEETATDVSIPTPPQPM